MPQSTTYEEVLKTASLLNEDERVRLVDDLICTLSPGCTVSNSNAWIAEIDRRSSELDSGAVTTIPWSEVRRRAHSRIS